MSKVNLLIGGRDYAVACAEGEEAHVIHLGRMIDEKLVDQPATTAQSEVRSLLFASLLLADELNELRESAALAAAPAPTLVSVTQDPMLAERINAVAEKIEKLASQLEVLA
ncbi:cell division protein ZapA [Novosphingobium umbonatum]|jgi:cell division protein ZapA|uniref:Cell division protein ZapA n=1 Tax=Novosphingobium umbonatum TaxID=1908524 RepID=A0A3S3TQA5_9SPHN|nr:cell division protein ZapA [Novosphingobium umbonatum]RVU06144.1 cell division protein ZapA [Novosphingobium umbonatum]